jgi:hypothetical protein
MRNVGAKWGDTKMVVDGSLELLVAFRRPAGFMPATIGVAAQLAAPV